MHPSFLISVILLLSVAISATAQQCSNGTVRFGSQCIRCPPGTQLDIPCQPCFIYQISTEFNSRDCTYCPEGQRPDPTKTRCIPDGCPPGSSVSERNEMQGNFVQEIEGALEDCYSCPFNEYRNSTMERCEECPGLSSILALDDRSGCRNCQPGEFLEIDPDEFRFCFNCPPGLTTFGLDETECVSENGPIECNDANSFVNVNGECTSCEVNQFRNITLNQCQDCPEFFSSAGGTQSFCQREFRRVLKCPKNTRWTAAGCQCNGNKRLVNGVCRSCPRGKESAVLHRCIQCDVTEFSNDDTSRCEKCPEGTYSGSTRGRRCVPLPKCPPGLELPAPGEDSVSYFGPAKCISSRTLCPRGLRRRALAGREGEKKALCENKMGHVVCPPSMVFNRVNRCIMCRKGFRLRKSKNSNRLQCVKCGPNSFSRGGLSRTCKPCKNGFTDFRRIDCICANGNVIDENGQCVPCEKPESELTRKTAPAGCFFLDRFF